MNIETRKNRIKILILFLLGLILISPSSLSAYKKTIAHKRFDITIFSGIEKIRTGEYDEAISIFKTLIEQDKENPVGYFYTAATYEEIMQTYHNRSFSKQFDFYIDNAIEKGENLAETTKDDEWLYFYLGGAYGYRAIDRSETGNWFGAFLDAIKGADYLEKAIKLNPEIYDAYYGFGVYKYWRSVKSKVLWFIPFIKDERNEGINNIITAIRMGKYANYEAKTALVGIYRNEKYYDYAMTLVNEMLGKYPEDFYLLKMKGILSTDMKDWSTALLIFNALNERLKDNKWKSTETVFEIEYYRTLIFYNLKKTEEYKTGCKTLIGLKEKIGSKKHSDAITELIKQVDALCRIPRLKEEPEA
jgi:tetratricopeptide (TPR) repeat protein